MFRNIHLIDDENRRPLPAPDFIRNFEIGRRRAVLSIDNEEQEVRAFDGSFDRVLGELRKIPRWCPRQSLLYQQPRRALSQVGRLRQCDRASPLADCERSKSCDLPGD